MQNGEEERYLSVNPTINKKVFMRTVKDQNGQLIGYYERFEEVKRCIYQDDP